MISASTAAESGSLSTKTDESVSLNDKYESCSSLDGDGGDVMSEEDAFKVDAPSDEEGGLAKAKIVRRKWELRDGMVRPSSNTDLPVSANGEEPPPATPRSLENAKLKWDNKTSSMTRERVDLLSPQSWHGKKKLHETTPVKNKSVPQRSRNRGQPGALTIPDVFQKKTEEDNNWSPNQAHGRINVPVAFQQAGDDESIGIPPTPNNARSKFTAMSESQNFESSTTSFITELPQIPRRRRYDDDDASVTSSVVRGGRVFKIFSPPVRRPFSSSVPSRPASSHTRVSVTSTDSTDGDITEYESVVPPARSSKRAGSLARSESGSSHNISIGTYDDEGGTPQQQEMPLQTIQSNGSEEHDYEIIPLKDAPPRNRDTDFDDYEEELQLVENLGENDFVVDKVPKKKRWSSRNIHDFPLWPPIIRVQTWQKRNVSAVSVGSGFTLEDSFTDSNAIMSSLGDDDVSYDESEFIRRPPQHRTSYRIRYDGPTSLNLDDIYKRPIDMDSSERFVSTGKPFDGLPSMPPRRVVDAAPSAPPRSSAVLSDDELSVTLDQLDEGHDEGQGRPDVWITPLAGLIPTEAMWKVKRFWAIEAEDEKEQEHDVNNHELFDKIKSLVGASKSPAGGTGLDGDINVEDSAPQLPQRSWHVQTVYEKKGYVENVAAEKDLNEHELEEDMEVMAQEAVKEIEKNQQIFEEYKKKREQRMAEEMSWPADVAAYSGLEVGEPSEERVLQVEGKTREELPERNIDSVEQTTTTDELPAPAHAARKDDDSVVISDSDDDSIIERKNEDDSKSPRKREKKPKKKKASKSSTGPQSPKMSKKSEKADASPATPRSSKRSARTVVDGTPSSKSSKSKPPTIDGPIDSLDLLPPKSPKKSSKNGVSPSTPRGGKKPKSKITTPKPPKDEKKKKSKKKSKHDPKDGKETKEKETPRQSKKKVVSMSQMVQEADDMSSSDDDGKNSSSSSDAASSDEHYEALTSSTSGKPFSARVSLSAMVHDSSDSELDGFESDDLSVGEDVRVRAPRVVQPGVSPRAGWWNTPSGRRSGRKLVPSAGELPPPLTGETARRSSKTG